MRCSQSRVLAPAALAPSDHLLDMQIRRPTPDLLHQKLQGRGAQGSAFHHTLQVTWKHAQVQEPVTECRGQQTFPVMSREQIFLVLWDTPPRSLLNFVLVALNHGNTWHACAPIKLYLEIMKFKFHIIYTCHKTTGGVFIQPLKNVDTCTKAGGAPHVAHGLCQPLMRRNTTQL